MKPYIDFNTAKRREAKSPFFQSPYKSLKQYGFWQDDGMSPGRIDLELVTNPTRAKKLIAKSTTQHWDIITGNLVVIKKQKPKIVVDRPIYLGFCILDLSKIVMYQFHYETILPKYGSLAKLAYTDTDSFIYHIQTPDLYKDMAENLDAYDTFDYPKLTTPSILKRMRNCSVK